MGSFNPSKTQSILFILKTEQVEISCLDQVRMEHQLADKLAGTKLY